VKCRVCVHCIHIIWNNSHNHYHNNCKLASDYTMDTDTEENGRSYAQMCDFRFCKPSIIRISKIIDIENYLRDSDAM
jgi:hypothetical protein